MSIRCAFPEPATRIFSIGYNHLTLLAAPGASINGASGGSDFTVFVAHTLTFDFEGFTVNGGLGLSFVNFSTRLFAANTFQNSVGVGVHIARSNVIMQGDTIQNNANRGIEVSGGATVLASGETVLNNGAAGMFAGGGSNLSAQFCVIQNSGTFGIRISDHTTLRVSDSIIQGNAMDGVSLESSSEGLFSNAGAGSTITGNAGAGVL